MSKNFYDFFMTKLMIALNCSKNLDSNFCCRVWVSSINKYLRNVWTFAFKFVLWSNCKNRDLQVSIFSPWIQTLCSLLERTKVRDKLSWISLTRCIAIPSLTCESAKNAQLALFGLPIQLTFQPSAWWWSFAKFSLILLRNKSFTWKTTDEIQQRCLMRRLKVFKFKFASISIFFFKLFEASQFSLRRVASHFLRDHLMAEYSSFCIDSSIYLSAECRLGKERLKKIIATKNASYAAH